MQRADARPWFGLTEFARRAVPREFAVVGAGALTLIVVGVSVQLTTVVPWLLAGCLFTPVFWAVYRGEPIATPRLDVLTIASFALVVWAGITLFWSPGGLEAVAAWVRLLVFLALTLMTRAATSVIEPDVARRIGWAFLAAVAVSIAIALVDAGFDMVIRRALMSIFGGAQAGLGAVVENGWVVKVQSFEINKSLSVLYSLFWPAALIATMLLPTHARGRTALAVGVAAFAVATALSDNETVKLALVVSAAGFALARWRPAVSTAVLAAGWVVCTLAIVPIVLAVGGARVHERDTLQDSARHRLVIWNFVAGEVLKHPIAGSGLASTRAKPGERGIVDLGPEGKNWVAGTAVQPHNNYLQVWNELGGIGAVLLCLTGLAIVREIARMPDRLRPYSAAAFSGAATLAGLQWTINSGWYLATFAVTALFLHFGTLLMDGASPLTPAPRPRQ